MQNAYHERIPKANEMITERIQKSMKKINKRMFTD